MSYRRFFIIWVYAVPSYYLPSYQKSKENVDFLLGFSLRVSQICKKKKSMKINFSLKFQLFLICVKVTGFGTQNMNSNMFPECIKINIHISVLMYTMLINSECF